MEPDLEETPKLSKIKHSVITTNAFEEQALQLKNSNNNHHVVPVGMLIVLFTIYLSITGLRHSYECYFEADIGDGSESAAASHRYIQQAAQMKETCMRMDILTVSSNSEKQLGQSALVKSSKPLDRLPNKLSQLGGKGGSKQQELSNKQKSSGLTTAATKKGNAAEPIIYLFALVLLYLLLRAASDINQHYKTQKKGDKRLRRCSLQSYAQAHKQDRRASKGISAKSLPKF